MSKSLGVLTLDLVARIGPFVQPLQNAERQTRKSAQRINQEFGRVTDFRNIAYIVLVLNIINIINLYLII